MNFCDILKELRLEKNLTQKQVAQYCNLTPTCICQLESGVRNPTGSTVAALARLFECSADYLLGLETEWGTKQFSVAAPTYTKAEQELLADFRQLSPNCQKIVRDTITNFLSVAARGSNKNIS